MDETATSIAPLGHYLLPALPIYTLRIEGIIEIKSKFAAKQC
jgi:hypothetical protein